MATERSASSALDVDTIVAVATPLGRGGIGIVRVSGPDAFRIARAVAGKVPEPRRVEFCRFQDAEGPIDEGLVIGFRGPASFTGEDVVEFHGHGAPVALSRLVRVCTGYGARLARPGEYTERSFLNGKLDLAQAEAVADLINASTEVAARQALRSLTGHFSDAINRVAEMLLHVRTHVEASLDFADEDIQLLADTDLTERLVWTKDALDDLLSSARQGAMVREGVTVAIAGAPNAGKSSLLNALAQSDRAIVTPHAGTTRDLIEVDIQVQGLPVTLIDTAGIREADDPVEREGVKRTRGAVESADVLLWIVDSTEHSVNSIERSVESEMAHAGELSKGARILIAWNKIDLSADQKAALRGLKHELQKAPSDPAHRRPRAAPVPVSAVSGEGLQALGQALAEIVGYHESEDGFSARARHVEALHQARASAKAAHNRLTSADLPELIAEDLRAAHDALGEIVGRVTPDDLLGEIFSTFCIGK